jgi:hypothetical protein
MATGDRGIVDSSDLDRVERVWRERMESEQDEASEVGTDSAEAELARLAEEQRGFVLLAPPEPSRERLRIQAKLASEPERLARFDQYYTALARTVADIAAQIAAGEQDYVPDADPILILVAARASGVKI